jgi:Ran GTPase-activating protein (RanGAP) involved in mRNA processing and transport
VVNELSRRAALNNDKIFRIGWMYKEGSLVKNWKRRLFVLYSSSIEYYAKPTDSSPKGTIKLDTCKISAVQNRAGVEKPCMELVTGAASRKWHFAAERLDDNERWYNAIENRIVSLAYERRCQFVSQEPDLRIVRFLAHVPRGALVIQSSEATAAATAPPVTPRHGQTIGANSATTVEQWPASRPIDVSHRTLSLDTVSMLARILSDCHTTIGGGISSLVAKSASLTPLEISIILKAIADGDFCNDDAQPSKATSFRRAASLHLYRPNGEQHGVTSIDFSNNTMVDTKQSAEDDDDDDLDCNPLFKGATIIDISKYPAMTALSSVLIGSRALRSLVLSDCKLTDAAMEIMSLALPNMRCQLEHIVLNRNQITSKGAIQVIEALAIGVEVKRADSYIENDGNDDNSAAAVSQRHYSVKSLCMRRNQIGGEGIGTAICGLLSAEGSKLKTLDLAHNSITDDDVMEFASSLRGSKTLHRLDLASNPIGDQEADSNGSAALIEAIQQNTSLKIARFGTTVLTGSTIRALRLAEDFDVPS